MRCGGRRRALARQAVGRLHGAMQEVARWGLGLCWIAAGGLAWARAGSLHRRAGMAMLLLAVANGTAAALRWHVDVYYLARGWLGEAGVYEQRGWFKLAIAVALVLLAAAAWFGARRLLGSLPPALRVSCCALLGWAFYLAAYTTFLDNFLPAAFGAWPWRQLWEALFAVVALVAASLPGGARAG